MLRASLPLIVLAITLAYAVLRYGAVLTTDWNICLLAVGLVSLLFWIPLKPRERAPRLEWWLRWPLALLPLYVLFQLIPFPFAVLRWLAPARMEVAAGLRPVMPALTWAPISFTPPASMAHLFRILAYAAVFLLIRELAWRFRQQPWVIVAPLLGLAALEALIGILQCAADWPNGLARGTYVDRDHFAGFLEMILPFAVAHGVVVWRRSEDVSGSHTRSALAACGLLGTAALMFVAIIYSLSQMGFVVALASLALVAGLALGPQLKSSRSRWAAGTMVTLGLLLFLLFFPPDQLMVRFADLAASRSVAADVRLQIWRDTLPLILSNPAFGCGLGGYESAFRRFQTSLPLLSVNFAHNDYLQGLAELGIVGFTLVAVLACGTLVKTARAALVFQEPERRYLAVACAGALFAILLHSLVDFNLQIPANAMLLAWIAGISASFRLSKKV